MKRLWSVLAATAIAVSAIALIGRSPSVSAHERPWVTSALAINSSDAQEDTNANPSKTNLCEGDGLGIFLGGDPGWAPVSGNPNMGERAFVEAHGQVLPDVDQGIALKKINPFVTYTDAPYNHYTHDLNVFLTLDPEDRGLLATGNFDEGDENEHGSLEVEWERGGIPMFAWPTSGDRLTVWGEWIFDCGHGGPSNYRTEIHPPVGWVAYRNTASTADRNETPPTADDGHPRNEQSPWKWYDSTDRPGAAARFTSTGMFDTPVRATVADAFFSSWGGNVPESLNGCDDSTFIPDATTDATCFHITDAYDEYEWLQPILKQDYTFFVPAPPKPAGDVLMVWEREDHCGDVPSSPGNPPGDDVEDVFESDDGAENIGAPVCITGDTVTETTNSYGQRGIQVTVPAASGGLGYAPNPYIVFAKRYKVGWDHVDADPARPHVFDFQFNTLRVRDDSEPCYEDGEWVLSLRVNEKWIHPLAGHGDSDTPFWTYGAVNDGKVCVGSDDPYKDYSIGESINDVMVLPGQPLTVYEGGWDDDTTYIDWPPTTNDSNQLLPRIWQPISWPLSATSWESGEMNMDVAGAHSILYTVGDVTDPQPAACCIDIGTPKYGPLPDTDGKVRVNGTDAHETPITVASITPGDIDGLEWRVWKVGDAIPHDWQTDLAAGDGLRIDLPSASADSGTYNVEWATIKTTSGRKTVSPRVQDVFQIDNTPPTLHLPADMTVYATETGGAHVSFTVSATDNFPGPVPFSCDHASGELFPNGLNAPKTTTVTCSATDAVANSATASFTITVVSPFGYLNDFVVLGIDWAQLGSGVVVHSGNIGAFQHSAGVPARPGFEVVAGPSAVLLGGPQLAGESDRLEASTLAGDAFYVDALVLGNGASAAGKLAYVPLFLGLPTAPAAGPGGANLSVSGTAALGPGAYGELSVKPNAVVSVGAGSYSFSSVDVAPGAALLFTGPTTIVVADRVSLGNGATAAPTVASGTQPRDVVLYALGIDGPPRNPAEALHVGSGVQLGLDAYAPNGTLSIGSSTSATGAFLGRRVDVGGGVALARSSSFVLS